MAIPDSPLTRSEEYLNNIATGEGAIPDVPLTRIEQYLDYITKNGGSGGGGSGGGVFVVDCTMNGAVITSNKTAGEIFEAIEDKTVVFKLTARGITAYLPLISASNGSGYVFTLAEGKKADGTLLSMEFSANSADDYPAVGD